MWWRLLQISVFTAVMSTDWVWHWNASAGPNSVLVPLCGFIAALLITVFFSWLINLSRTLVAKLSRPAQQPGDRWIGGWERLGASQPERRAHGNHSIKIADRFRR